MFAVIVFALGAVMGSFANVCVSRSHLGQSLFMHSRCPECGYEIAWYDLIPLLNFTLWLQGKCRYCRHPIPWRYPLMELFVAGGFLGFYLLDQFSPVLIYHCTLFLLLLIIAVGNFLYQEIDAWQALIALFWVLGWQFYFGNCGLTLAGGGLGLLLSGGIFLIGRLKYKIKSFGIGDVFLSAVIGEIVGWGFIIPVYAGALVLHMVFATVRICWIRYVRRTDGDFNELVPFGPPLVIATALLHPIQFIIAL